MRNNIFFSVIGVGVLLSEHPKLLLGGFDGLERAGQPGEPRIVLCEKGLHNVGRIPLGIYGDVESSNAFSAFAETIQHV